MLLIIVLVVVVVLLLLFLIAWKANTRNERKMVGGGTARRIIFAKPEDKVSATYMQIRARDYRLPLNPIFHPFIQAMKDPRNFHLYYGRSYKASLKVIKNMMYGIGLNCDDEFLTNLADEWSWKNPEEFIERYERFMSLSAVEVFHLLTYRSYSLLPEVEEFFSKIKIPDHNDFVGNILLINDIIIRTDDVAIITSEELPSVVEYLSRPDDILLCPESELKRGMMLTKVQSSTPEFDIEYDDTELKIYKMRSVDKIERDRKGKCHDVAHWIKKQLPGESHIFMTYVDRHDTDIYDPSSTHSFVVNRKEDGKWYIHEATWVIKYGVSGGFLSIEEAVNYMRRCKANFKHIFLNDVKAIQIPDDANLAGMTMYAFMRKYVDKKSKLNI